MRGLLVAILLIGSPAMAADAPKPDYSPDALRHILSYSEDHPPVQGNVHWTIGGVEFRAFGMNWRIGFLPFAMPLSGSVRGSDPSSMWPDPFALTNTKIAETPRTWRDNRALSRERRRIEKSMRQRAKVAAQH